jgi:hypothetical protein
MLPEATTHVRTWWRHKGGDAGHQLQWREMQLVGLAAALVHVVVAAGLAALL